MASNNKRAWNNMVTITVPDGLNGWQYSGAVTINGRTYTFPVGVETQVPEPVAEYIQRLIEEEEANKPVNPNQPSSGLPSGADPHQQLVTDAEGNPKWEDREFYDGFVEKPVCLVNAFPFIGEENSSTNSYVADVQKFPLNDDFPDFDKIEQYKRIIVFDGKEYECNLGAGYTGAQSFWYGNKSLGFTSQEEDTGEPFLWFWTPQYETMRIYTNDTELTMHIIAAYSTTETKMVEAVKKLDGKYLPDGVPYSGVGEKVIIPETTEVTEQVMGGSGLNILNLSGQNPFVIGQEYTVVWDGVTINAIAQDLDGAFGLNIEQNGLMEIVFIPTEPYFLAVITDSDHGTTHTIKVTTIGDIVNKLDPKCLPAVVFTYDTENDVCTCDHTFKGAAEAAANFTPFCLAHEEKATGLSVKAYHTLPNVTVARDMESGALFGLTAQDADGTSVMFNPDGSITVSLP